MACHKMSASGIGACKFTIDSKGAVSENKLISWSTMTQECARLHNHNQISKSMATRRGTPTDSWPRNSSNLPRHARGLAGTQVIHIWFVARQASQHVSASVAVRQLRHAERKGKWTYRQIHSSLSHSNLRGQVRV